MENEITESKISQALDWAYEKAINGVVGLDSASDLASDYMKGSGSTIDQANSLIRWQNTKAATSGFVTGLGGLLLMPATIPANIASVLYVQIRMIAAIAIMGGHDVRDDRVKAMIYACLVGDGIKEMLKDAGMVVGMKLAMNAIKGISGSTILKINQAIGIKLVTKMGQGGIVNLGKMVPFLGGVIGGTFDAVTTNTVGNIARNVFIDGRLE